MSAFWIAAFIIRNVETRRSSRLFMASFKALLMSARNTGPSPECDGLLFTQARPPLTAAVRQPI
jgi:hypothetical protein